MGDHTYFQGIDSEGLYLVKPPRTGLQYTCDIFVVHGLNGGPCKTWRHPDTNVVWFRDLLPEHVRDEVRGTNARIWTYGYNAQAAFLSAAHQAGAFNFAQDLLFRVRNVRDGCENHKIIWVCHSLGGIVVKTALIQAQLDQRYRPIVDATVGIVFMGTPHQGSGFANIADIAARIGEAVLPSMLFSANRTLVSCLKKDCAGLFQTAHSFTRISTSMKVYSFYEQLPQVGDRVIVEERSAVINIQNETTAPLNANHRNMCKFKDSDDQNFTLIRASICELMKLTSPPRGPQFRREPPPGRRDISNSPYYNPNNLPRPTPFLRDNVPVDGQHVLPPNAPPPTPRTGGVPQYETYRAPAPSAPAEMPSINVPTDSAGGMFAGTSSAAGENVPFSASSRSRPYHHLPNPAYSTENLHRRYTQASSAAGQNSANLSVPSGQPHQRSVSQPTLSTNMRNESPGRHDSAPSDAAESQEQPNLWKCDACDNNFLYSRARIHCTECEDYDLCESCFQRGRTSLRHKSNHKTRQILQTHNLGFDDLTSPNEKVHPPYSQGGSLCNWTVEGDPGKEKRWQHLYQHDNHARFLATGIEPGNYVITLELAISVSNEVTVMHKQQLQSTGMGKLRATAGIPKNPKQFHNDRYIEDENLKDKLFSQARSSIFKIPARDFLGPVELHGVLHVEAATHSTSALGILLQWSDVRSFQGSPDKSLVKISLLQVRLEDLLEYSDSGGQASSQPAAETARTASTTSTHPTTTDATSDDATITIDDVFQAILEAAQEQRSQEEHAAFNAALQARLREQERENDETVFRTLAQRILAEQEAQKRRENWETVGQLLALNQYIQEQERKQAEEKKRKEQIEALRFQFGMLNYMAASRR